jgi:hypothetical protein
VFQLSSYVRPNQDQQDHSKIQKKKEKAEDKSLDKTETYLPDDDTGILEDELNRLLYQHAQMDQIQLLENIKENKLDAQAQLEKYIR